jgi:hypothetical protein
MIKRRSASWTAHHWKRGAFAALPRLNNIPDFNMICGAWSRWLTEGKQQSVLVLRGFRNQ